MIDNKPPENLWIALAPSRTKETEFECLAFTEEPVHGALKYLMQKYVHISLYERLQIDLDWCKSSPMLDEHKRVKEENARLRQELDRLSETRKEVVNGQIWLMIKKENGKRILYWSFDGQPTNAYVKMVPQVLEKK